jgi:hypothetical protein
MEDTTKINLSDTYKPREYQRDIFDAIENKGIHYALLCWPRRCLHGDTHIIMADGSFKLLKEIQEGDLILSWNGTEFEPDSVKYIWRTGPKETLKISAHAMPDIITSRDHLFYSYNIAAQYYSWTKACDIEINDNLFTYYNDGIIKRVIDVRPCAIESLYDIETAKNHNFVANGYLVHNSGKDVTLWHLILRQALKNVGVYFYCLPTYSQGKTVIWQSIRNDGLRIVDMVPEDLIYKKNESNMSIELHNGSIIKLVGSDSYNKSIRGSNPKGIVFSEYAQADPEAFRVALSIVQNNNGFIIIQSTPFGHNDFYTLYKIAKEDPQWFCQKLTVEDTKHISEQDIQHMIDTNVISYEFSRQEYYTDFNIGATGSFYGQYLIKARLDGRVGVVPYETHYPTYTAWDLGVSDSCAIIFFQLCEGGAIHIIDYYENNKLGLEHYCKYVLSKDYTYAQHFAPFDIGVQEFGSGLTRYQMAQRMGIEFTIIPKSGLLDGIEVVRCTFSRFYINEATCERLISCIQNYSQEWDTKNNVYKPTPKHTSYSHGADALRYLANSLNLIEKETSAEDLQKRYLKAMAEMHGVPYNLNTYRYR